MESRLDFDVIDIYETKRNQRYRVFVQTTHLDFIWSGKGEDVAQMVRPFGAIGWLLSLLCNPARENRRREEEVNEKPLADLVQDHPMNFRMLPTDVLRMRLSARTLFERIWYFPSRFTTVWEVHLRQHGRHLFGFPAASDEEVARTVIPALFDNVVWDL